MAPRTSALAAGLAAAALAASAAAVAAVDAEFPAGEEPTPTGCGCNALTREAANDALEDGENGGQERYTRDAKSPSSMPTAPLDRTVDGEPAELSQLISLKGGNFKFGNDAGFFPEDQEGPAFKVKLSPFRIGAHEVSNERFAAFVQQTGYRTEAETFGNSFVVEQFVSQEVSAGINSSVAAAPWWIPVPHSTWDHPEGADSNLTSRGDRMKHPAVHVSWNDAMAFCRWSTKGGRLPTEAEWEFAASGGKQGKNFPWGNKLGKKHKMNSWQSTIEKKFLQGNVFKHSYLPIDDGHRFFSAKNSAADGYELTAPVDSYSPNGYGLYNTVGNVWEWTQDWQAPAGVPRSSFGLKDPKGPPTGMNKVKKGGSFMCHQFTCYRYRIAARMFITPDSSASNVGFRCAADAEGQ